MYIQMNEEKRRAVVKAWHALATSLSTSKNQTEQVIRQDIKQLANEVAKADISSGKIHLTYNQEIGFVHACSYLGDGWKPQVALTEAEFSAYDEFVDDFFDHEDEHQE